MAGTLFINVGSVSASGAAAAVYVPVVGMLNGVTTTEELVQLGLRKRAGYLLYLYTRVPTSTTVATTTILVRKTAANTTLSVSYLAAQTGIKEQSSALIGTATTDTVNYRILLSGLETGTLTLGACSLGFGVGGNLVKQLVSARGPLTISTATTIYNAMNGKMLGTTVEADTKFSAGKALTATNLFVYVSAAVSASQTTVLKTRINGVDGTQSVTYTNMQTGLKEDTVNTDVISVGDDFNFSTVTTGATVNITVEFLSCSVENVGVFFPLMASSTDGIAVAFNTTTYCGCAGDLIFTTTEANTQVRPRQSFTIRQLGSFVNANTIATSATVVTFRKGGVNSALTVSYNAAQTGLKSDGVNTAAIVGGIDFMNYKVVTPNTSGNINFTYIGLLSKNEGISNNLFVKQAVNRVSTY